MVGSSWKSAESSGVAPMRSPADTKTLFEFSDRRFRTWVARYSTPPAGMQFGVPPTMQVWFGKLPWSEPIRPLELDVGFTTSSCPWKSFSPRIWTSTGRFALSLLAMAAGADMVKRRANALTSAATLRIRGARVTEGLLGRGGGERLPVVQIA